MRQYQLTPGRLTGAVLANLHEATRVEMNDLQDHGVISDLCVTWEDVAESDRPAAREFLKRIDKELHEVRQLVRDWTGGEG